MPTKASPAPTTAMGAAVAAAMFVLLEVELELLLEEDALEELVVLEAELLDEALEEPLEEPLDEALDEPVVLEPVDEAVVPDDVTVVIVVWVLGLLSLDESVGKSLARAAKPLVSGAIMESIWLNLEDSAARDCSSEVRMACSAAER